MNEWKTEPAKEFCSSVRDGTHDSPKPVEVGRKLITSRHMISGRLDLESAYLISAAEFEEINRRSKVDQWDVLISMIGTVGEVYLEQSDPDYAIKNIGLFKSRSQRHGRWLYYYLKSPEARAELRSRCRGTTQLYISLGELRAFPIRFPPDEAEQDHVVEILGSLDDKIELNRRMNETLEAMAQTIFRDWFVDFGPTRRKIGGETDPVEIMGGLVSDPDRARELADLFPARIGDDGQPEGWREGALGDLVTNAVERCEPSVETRNRPYVPIDTITAKSLIIQNIRPGSEAQSSLVTFRQGDILFGAMRPYFHKVALADFDGTTRTTVFVLRPKTRADLGFSLMIVNDEATIEYATQHSSGTTIPYAVWRNSLERMPVPFPPTNIRSAYGQFIGPMLSRMQASASQNHVLAATRDLLLPKLMSGEIRLQDAEREAAA